MANINSSIPESVLRPQVNSSQDAASKTSGEDSNPVTSYKDVATPVTTRISAMTIGPQDHLNPIQGITTVHNDLCSVGSASMDTRSTINPELMRNFEELLDRNKGESDGGSVLSEDNKRIYRTSSPGALFKSIGMTCRLLTESITKRMAHKSKKVDNRLNSSFVNLSSEASSKLEPVGKSINNLAEDNLYRSLRRGKDDSSERTNNNHFLKGINFTSPLSHTVNQQTDLDCSAQDTYDIPKGGKPGNFEEPLPCSTSKELPPLPLRPTSKNELLPKKDEIYVDPVTNSTENIVSPTIPVPVVRDTKERLTRVENSYEELSFFQQRYSDTSEKETLKRENVRENTENYETVTDKNSLIPDSDDHRLTQRSSPIDELRNSLNLPSAMRNFFDDMIHDGEQQDNDTNNDHDSSLVSTPEAVIVEEDQINGQSSGIANDKPEERNHLLPSYTEAVDEFGTVPGTSTTSKTSVTCKLFKAVKRKTSPCPTADSNTVHDKIPRSSGLEANSKLKTVSRSINNLTDDKLFPALTQDKDSRSKHGNYEPPESKDFLERGENIPSPLEEIDESFIGEENLYEELKICSIVENTLPEMVKQMEIDNNGNTRVKNTSTLYSQIVPRADRTTLSRRFSPIDELPDNLNPASNLRNILCASNQDGELDINSYEDTSWSSSQEPTYANLDHDEEHIYEDIDDLHPLVYRQSLVVTQDNELSTIENIFSSENYKATANQPANVLPQLPQISSSLLEATMTNRLIEDPSQQNVETGASSQNSLQESDTMDGIPNPSASELTELEKNPEINPRSATANYKPVNRNHLVPSYTGAVDELTAVPEPLPGASTTLKKKSSQLWKNIIEETAHNNGTSIHTQQLTNDEVPVMIAKCIDFINTHGSMSEWIYRKSGSSSKINELLQLFKKDAFAVQLSREDFDEYDVAGALKNFIRDMPDCLFGSYVISFVSITNLKSTEDKILSYKELLSRLPTIEYQTLKKLISHLRFIASLEKHNKMDVPMLVFIWGTILMINSSHSNEVRQHFNFQNVADILADLIKLHENLFLISPEDVEKEQLTLNQVEEYHSAEDVSITVTYPTDLKVWIRIECDSETTRPATNEEKRDISVTITPTKTASDICRELASKTPYEWYQLLLYEVIGEGSLTRPVHYSEKALEIVLKWTKWKDADKRNNYLSVRPTTTLNDVFRHIQKTPTSIPATKLKFADRRTKMLRSYKLQLIGREIVVLKQVSKKKGALYEELLKINLETVHAYLGREAKRDQSSLRWSITLVEKGFKKRTRDAPFIGQILGGTDFTEQILWYSSILHSLHLDDILPNQDICPAT